MRLVLNFNVSGYILFLFFFLFIMFQLKVRSHGICPSPFGLFHLTMGRGEWGGDSEERGLQELL